VCCVKCKLLYRFASVRTAGDKYRCAFEPVGEDMRLSPAIDNLYIKLDKQNVYLATKVKEHPNIFICVLRRSSATKQLDLHVFVCDSAQQALTIATQLQLLYERSAQSTHSSSV